MWGIEDRAVLFGGLASRTASFASTAGAGMTAAATALARSGREMMVENFILKVD
jgi:hypothetical protein